MRIKKNIYLTFQRLFTLNLSRWLTLTLKASRAWSIGSFPFPIYTMNYGASSTN